MSAERGRSTGAGRRRARHPVARRDALPRRVTDRVEDLAAWAFTAIGLFAAVGAVVVGVAAHDAADQPGRIDDATPVRAVLLADVPSPPTAAQRIPPPAARVPVSWTSADGVEQVGELALRTRLHAGARLTVWADRDGRLTISPPPEHQGGAVAFGVGATLAAASGAWAVLTLLWSGLGRVVAARNDAAWAREWARVEPLWSRRVR